MRYSSLARAAGDVETKRAARTEPQMEQTLTSGCAVITAATAAFASSLQPSRPATEPLPLLLALLAITNVVAIVVPGGIVSCLRDLVLLFVFAFVLAFFRGTSLVAPSAAQLQPTLAKPSDAGYGSCEKSRFPHGHHHDSQALLETHGEDHLGQRYFQEPDIWQQAPVLTGTTQFEPRSDVRNIMITGGAGFIALNDKRNFTFYHGDLTNPSEVLDCMERYHIDTVMHFAAQSHVDLSFGNSYSFTHANVYGTHVLLESAKRACIKRFIHVSTDEVYGEVGHGEDELQESSILAPTNPYAASKAAAEMMVHSYHKSFKLPTIIVRSNNVYGPHQYPEKIISKFICLLNRGRPVVLHGDGSPTRRYLFAADAADAFDTILHKGQVGHVYNVGSHDEISNLELCGKILSAMEISHDTPEQFRKWVKYTHDRPFNDCRYAVDASKLRNLGWEQKTTFEEGLQMTVEWYRRFGEHWWGDISHVLTPFPIVSEGEVVPDVEHLVKDDPPTPVEDYSTNGISHKAS
ncbi:dtdp-d-glucose 4,6-dehydratase [Trichoderma arundinaceum]|uniref:Dtdp-d-glucose 4,6-dehydratase n=1 Tax=Trichoderma arundinaceum TaxID=490622 RepID=A0A395NJR3_TRIAR|nr:dtdp-d-glucose 4,6-dehydratase [Trichoderma arundinaceum]